MDGSSVLFIGSFSLSHTSAGKEPKLIDFTYLRNPTTGASVRIIETIQANWPQLAEFLWLPSHTIANLRANPNYAPGTACREVFNIWLNGDDTLLMPKNWNTVIKVMGQLGNAKLGQAIKEALMGMLYDTYNVVT